LHSTCNDFSPDSINESISSPIRSLRDLKISSSICFNLENKINRIIIYPIKGCQCVEVDEVEIINGMIKYDRHWTIYDTETSKCIELSTNPNMVKIKPYID